MTIFRPMRPTQDLNIPAPRPDHFRPKYDDCIPIVTRDQARGAAKTVIEGAADDTDALAIIRALGIAELAR